MSWRTEFGPSWQVPDREIAAAGLSDVSWHNDACPSFAVDFPRASGADVHDLRLWVDHVDPSERELCGPRYGVNYNPHDEVPVPNVPYLGSDSGDDIYSGDDLSAALAAYVEVAGVIAAELARRAAA